MPYPHRPARKALMFMATHTWSLKKNGKDDRHPYQSHSIPSGNPSNTSPEGAPLLWKVCNYICIFWWSLNLLPEWCKWSPWHRVHRSLCELFKFTPSPHVPCLHAALFLLCKSHLQHLLWLTDMAGTRARCQQAWPSALWRLMLVGNAEMLSIEAWQKQDILCQCLGGWE